MNEDNVELALFQREDKSYYWELKVSSEIKPGLKSVGILEFEKANQRQHLGTLGGAMAEELCEKYSDTIEPTAIANATMDAYDEIIASTPTVKFGKEAPRASDKHIIPGSLAHH